MLLKIYQTALEVGRLWVDGLKKEKSERELMHMDNSVVVVVIESDG